MEQNLTLGDPGVENNIAVKNYFLRRGLSWGDEYRSLMDELTNNNSAPLTDSGLSDVQLDQYYAWNVRMSFKIVIQTYEVIFIVDISYLFITDSNCTSRPLWEAVMLYLQKFRMKSTNIIATGNIHLK